MICKNCGKEIDDDSLFCEFCGEDVSDLSIPYYNNEENTISKKKNSLRKLLLILFFLFVVFIVILLYSNGSSKYYDDIKSTIDNQIDNFEFQGTQIIESVEIDYNTSTLKCNISPNNVDLKYLNLHSVNVQDKDAISICDIYCTYDLTDESFSFEDKYMSVNDETEFEIVNSENAYNYSIKNCDNINYAENTVYKFSYKVWFGAAKPTNIFEKLYYKENKSKLKREITYTSYFIYNNGSFKPVSPQNVPYEAVNAIWTGSELYNGKIENNKIKYDDVIRTWKG